MRLSSLRRGGLLTAAAVMSANVGAAEVVLTLGLEQRLETGENVDLDIPEEGQTTTSDTRLTFGAVSQTELDLLEFSAGGALRFENSDQTDGTEFSFATPSAGLRYTREVPNSLFSIGASYLEDDVDEFEDDLTSSSLAGTRADTAADIRFETGRTAPVGVAFTTSFDRVEYTDTTDPDLTDTDTYRANIDTILRFSEALEGRIGLGYEREEEEFLPVDETVFASLGVSSEVANGIASADLIFSTGDEEGDRTTFVIGRTLNLPASSLNARLGVTNRDEGDTEFVGGLAWTQELPRGSVELAFDQRVEFDEDADEDETITVFSLSLAQDLNEVSSLGLRLFHEISDEPSDRSEYSEVAATYRYELTRDWGLDSGVRYRVRDDSDGRSESPDVFIALNRNFEFRP